MWLKVLLGVLTTLIVISVAVILFVALKPEMAREVADKAVKGEALISRRPPPRPTPAPSTPTPLPTPDTKAISRRIRVKAEDFPFRVSNRTQSNDRMRITLDIQNKSGRVWPVAYLTLSSAYHPDRTHYRIDNWKEEEVRSVDYVFPAREMSERLRELRIEDVSGVPPTEKLSDAREALGSAAAMEEPEAQGTLGLWKGLKDAVGVPPPPPEEIADLISQSSPEAAKEIDRGTGLTINLDGLGEVDTTPLALQGVSGSDADMRKAYNEAVQAADNAVRTIKNLGRTLAEIPWKEAMTPDGPGTRQLDDVREAVDFFQSKAVRIQQIHTRTPSAETERLIKSLEQASGTLLSYQEALERQVRAAQPGFKLTE